MQVRSSGALVNMEIFMKSRIIWSVLALVAYFVVVNVYSPVQGVVSAQLGPQQVGLTLLGSEPT